MSRADVGATVQALRFAMVGASAAVTHWVCAVIAMHCVVPLVANVVGFACAFWVSFAGHFHWSFRGHGAHWAHALPRFLAVALSSFAGNELLYAALLRWTSWPPQASLVVTLLAVAVSTFVLSRGWAFARLR